MSKSDKAKQKNELEEILKKYRSEKSKSERSKIKKQFIQYCKDKMRATGGITRDKENAEIFKQVISDL